MTIYIQRKSQGFALETVDEFPTHREALQMVKEYRLSDPSAEYYLSARACKSWADYLTDEPDEPVVSVTTNSDGSLTLAAVVGNRRIKHQYFGYSETSARAEFALVLSTLKD